MKYLASYIYLLITYLICFSNYKFISLASYADNFKDLTLANELKQGNLLIGLIQFIGNKESSIPVNKILRFQTENSFLELNSSNGIQHKSKSIELIFKKVPLQVPIKFKRYVVGPFASYESAKKESLRLESEGIKNIIAYPNDWEVWIRKDSSNSFNTQFKEIEVKVEDKIVPFLQSKYTYQQLDGPIHINSIEKISINDKGYGKVFQLKKDAYGTWTLIQKISFNRYLQGVIPHEIGSGSPLEALKAQSVIARTWAIYNADRFKTDKYHLCITTQCQVYKPTSKNYQNIEKAISDTNNLILVFNNKPINALFHASNGGVSAGADESWQMNSLPYLQPKFDLVNNLNNSFRLPIENSKNLINYLNQDSSQFYGNDHYLFRWEKVIKLNQINNLLIKNELFDKKGKRVDFKIIERGLSGRVTKLEILQTDRNNSFVLVKDDIRRYLKFLPSNLFTINKLNDNLWSFKGGGFGHGVGLSQSGAIEMAESGLNYEKILNHYYRGTKVRNISDLH